MHSRPPTHDQLLAPAGKAAETVRVVLVEPGDGRNAGAVARAMSNFGFGQLHLVAPRRLDWDAAQRTACWGAPVLKAAQVHARLEDALSQVQYAVGFTARHGRNRPNHTLLSAWCAQDCPVPRLRTALIFGGEEAGLHREDLEHCHVLVRIPTSPQNPSLNLAHAVLLVLAEITRSTGASALAAPPRHTPEPVRMEQLAPLEHLVKEIARQSRFQRRGTPPVIPGLMRRMIRRMQPNERELGLLLGFFGRVHALLAAQEKRS